MKTNVNTPTEYQQIGTFDMNRCTVCKNGKWNVVNQNGELLLDKWYDEVIRISSNHFILRDINDYSFYNLSKKKFAQITSDENGIYSMDDKTLLYPFVKDGVVTVRAGIRHLFYSISNDPDIHLKPQILNVRKIVFEEGVEKIYNGWSGLYDVSLCSNSSIDICIPLSVVAIGQNTFVTMIPAIHHIYIPRRNSYNIRLMLNEKLREYTRINRIFVNSKKELVFDPTWTFFSFWKPSRKHCWQTWTIYSFYFILLCCIFYKAFNTYQHTFLPFHIDELLFGVIFLLPYVIDYSIKWINKYLQIKWYIQVGLRIAVSWSFFIVTLAILSIPAIFIVNNSFGSPLYVIQSKKISIDYLQYKVAPRGPIRKIKMLKLWIDDSNNYALTELDNDKSYDNVSSCKVYFHRGYFGWNVLDGIRH